MVQFDCPRHWKPSVSFCYEIGIFPFPINWPSGVIRMVLPVWKWKSWKIFRTKVAWRDGNGPGWVSMALKNPLLPLCFYLLLESLPEPRHFEMRGGCELSRHIVAFNTLIWGMLISPMSPTWRKALFSAFLGPVIIRIYTHWVYTDQSVVHLNITL